MSQPPPPLRAWCHLWMTHYWIRICYTLYCGKHLHWFRHSSEVVHFCDFFWDVQQLLPGETYILKLLIFLLLTSCECRWILPCTFIFLYHLLVWDISWFCVMLKDLLSEVHYSRWEHSNWWQCEWGSWERSANIKDVGIPTALQLKLVCNSDITCSAWFERLLVPQTSKNKCVE